MQSLEAIFSLIFLLSILSTIPIEKEKQDNSLYLLFLAEDSWKVLYLKNVFHEINREETEYRLKEISELTGFCYYLSGIRYTSCRGNPTENIISINKLIYDGSLKNVTFSLSTY